MKRVKTSLMGRLAQLVRASCWISSRCHDLAEVSGAFWNLSLIYKICSSLYILIGLQRNILYSKPNQHATPFIRHVVLIIQRFWVRPLTLAMLREHLFGPYGCFHLIHHNFVIITLDPCRLWKAMPFIFLGNPSSRLYLELCFSIFERC